MELIEQLFGNRSIFGLAFDVSSNSEHTEKEVAFSFKQLVISPEHQAIFLSQKNE